MSERTDIESTSWLDGLPAEYVTAELRQTVEKAAADAARRGRNREAAEGAEAAIQAAVAAGDDEAAAEAIQRKAALGLLLDRLPAPGYSPTACSDAVEHAQAKISAALGEVQELPLLHSDLETEAHRELALSRHPDVAYPVRTQVDVEASAARAAVTSQRQGMLKSVQQWRDGAMSLQDRLSSAVGIVGQLHSLAEECKRVSALVDSANVAHEAVAYQIPSQFDSQQPPAVVELLRWRHAVALAASPELVAAS